MTLEWMRDICFFALMTGARMTEILTMTWSKIDFNQSIAIVTSDIAKSGRARALPLNREAINFLRQKETKRISDYVFHRGKGKMITDIDRDHLHKALELSNISDFRFHDFRHTWASWHVQAGTVNLKRVRRMGNIEMVQKYAHLNTDHLLTYANHVKFTSNGLIDTTKLEAKNDDLENKKAVSY